MYVKDINIKAEQKTCTNNIVDKKYQITRRMHQQRARHNCEKKIAEESVKDYFADLIDLDMPRDSRKAMN